MTLRSNRVIELFRFVLISMLAACIAGATMGILNVLLEFLRGDSLFGLESLFGISVWHILIWMIFGIFVGIFISIFSIFSNKILVRRFSTLAYFYICSAGMLLLIGFINIHYLPNFFSSGSLVWNFILFFACIFFLLLILRFLKKSRMSNFPLILKLQTLLLVMVLVFSCFLNLRLGWGGKERAAELKRRDSNRKNVILILLDAVRSDHLGCYGYVRNTSPSIDRIASSGVLFENAFAQSSHTTESVPSLFTSVYPSTHNVRHLFSLIPKNLITLPFVFQSNGYKTAVFSAMTFVSSTYGYKKGVDEFYEPQKNLIESTVLPYSISKILSFSFVQSLLNAAKLGGLENILRLSYKLYHSKFALNSSDADYFTQRVISWISLNQGKPFFLYLHYRGGHYPYDPPDPYDKLFDPDYKQKPVSICPEPSGLFLPFVSGTPVPSQEVKNMIAQYDGKILYHDRSLGLLFDHLRRLNLIDRSIIVITSDHGEEFYEHQGWAHGHSLYDELIHVPLILHCPGHIPQGKRISDFVELVDVFPTLCHLSKIEYNSIIPYKIEGVDLSSLFLEGEKKTGRAFIFSELNRDYGSMSCIRTKKFKAVEVSYEKRRKTLLFDLASDPLEKNNIYENQRQVGDELLKRLEAVIYQAQRKAFKARKRELDENTKERLRALGYIK